MFVGNRKRYKNFKNFILAYSQSNYLKQNYSVIAFGGNKFSFEETMFFKKQKIEKKIIHKQGNSKKLSKIYKFSSLFVFPSFDEGFGLPLLEAMRAGCPIVCSNISVFKEVAGNACAYFNPRSIIDIKTKIESVLKSQKKNKTLINNGFKRVQKFSWKKCSDETSHLYSNVLKEKS